ncbi:hypothetical protein RGUI_3026 [Rhodovulum sp. P5]|uniref:VPLPA-CTERM sorting domain-containing protein n=1 Tax=Rhodovulum sp. P5 TaxID=1564506 RepID=UPI0009C31F9B|nr:VPLPA-CTERM sorting domain-containing protein [Rhodovulum sp. P5]ARE41167.1 hypothetical protein RGUI_3026 [Rhodovulum sp. P5]
MKNALTRGAAVALLAALPVAAAASGIDATYAISGSVFDETTDSLGDAFAFAVADPAALSPSVLDSGDLADIVGEPDIFEAWNFAEGDATFGDFAFASAATTSVLSITNNGPAAIVVTYQARWLVDFDVAGNGFASAGFVVSSGTGDADSFAPDAGGTEADVTYDTDSVPGATGSVQFQRTIAGAETLSVALEAGAEGFADYADLFDSTFLSDARAYMSVVDVTAVQPNPVPLPTTLPLMVVGMGGLMLLRRRR